MYSISIKYGKKLYLRSYILAATRSCKDLGTSKEPLVFWHISHCIVEQLHIFWCFVIIAASTIMLMSNFQLRFCQSRQQADIYSMYILHALHTPCVMYNYHSLHIYIIYIKQNIYILYFINKSLLLLHRFVID